MVDQRLGRGRISDGSVRYAIARFDPEIVFHLAAVHHVPWCREHPRETLENNVLGMTDLLQELGASLRTFVFASSAAVYGFGDTGFCEADSVAPADVYGLSKWMGEELLRRFAARHRHVACVAARLFNVVGPGDKTDHLIPRIARETKKGRLVRLGNFDSRRDYVHVDDVANALTEMAAFEMPGFHVRNVGTGIGTSVADVLETFRGLGHHVAVVSDEAQRRREDGDLVAAAPYPGIRHRLSDAVAEVMA